MRLIGRQAEQRLVDELLDGVRGGMSRTLVVCGAAGLGKTAVLDYAASSAPDLQILRTVGIEPERALAFAGLHQLLLPLLPATVRLPKPQKHALSVAFGEISAAPADPFLVGLAALTCLSAAAEVRPVLCIVDDVQWLDDESTNVLGFVARRLLADQVAMLFGLDDDTGGDLRLPTLPVLRLEGLSSQDAGELLKTTVRGHVDPAVADRIATLTGGNPLALGEAARELHPDQLAGRAPLPEPLPIGRRLRESFARRLGELSDETRTLLLLAAADQPGRADRMSRAATALGIPESATATAEASGIVVFWPDVRFSHPLGRSAVYQAATATERRQAHRALAAVADADGDVDARAWHLAAAATGPDESAAAAQQAAAERARGRGGHAAAAALLERAAQLTPDPRRRAERRLSAAGARWMAGAVDAADAQLEEALHDLRDPLSQARAMRLKGRIALTRGQVGTAAPALVAAAQRLLPHDPGAARDALLSALEASVYAGWGSSPTAPPEIARTARGLALPGDLPDSASNLLLHGYIARVTEGHAAAVPAQRRAVQAFLADDLDPDVALQRLALAAVAAADLLDDQSVERLTTRLINRARESGALARLAAALAFRSAIVDAPRGRLAAARAVESEAHELAEVTHNPGAVPPTGTHRLPTMVLSGHEEEARRTAAAALREAPNRGAVGEAAFASAYLGVLELSLGNYAAAAECLRPAWSDDTPLVGTRVLPDLVEAAGRAGLRPLAEEALARLDERATASGTPLALGLLARSRALLADPSDAGGGYRDAEEALGMTDAAPELARTHLLHGEWLRRQRRRREARDELRTAHDMFDAMGLEIFARRAGLELRATGEHTRRREPGHPEQLTAQEARIAALVSRGEANRDIATQLFISPSTVEYHLHKVFRKLGLTSRTQLARQMLDAGGDVVVGATGASPVTAAGVT